MESDWPLASWKRLLLAAYIDLLIFGAPWTVGVWAASKTLPGFQGESLLMKFALFAVIETLLFRIVKWSPGQFALGIVEAPGTWAFESAEPAETGPVYVVDPWLLENERWWTVLSGVLFLMDGSKAMVRWAMFSPPAPWFGVFPSKAESVILFVVVGFTGFILGGGMLRLRRFILPLGLVLFGIQFVSNLVSWSAWPIWAERYVAARAAFGGTPVGEGQVELAQTFIPGVVVAGPIIGLLFVLNVYRRVPRAPAV